jgi:endoglucanase
MPSRAVQYLRQLVEHTGPSGCEEDVAQTIARLVQPLVDSVYIDALGNVIAIRRADAPEAKRCVLAAHMDEVGFRISKIEQDGFLRFEKVGGTDNRVLLGQRVWVRSDQGRLLGVIGTKSAHLCSDEDRKSVPPHTEQYIDIGARSANEVGAVGVRLGSPVGFTGELTELGAGTGRYTAHALDDRAGCAIVLAVLDELRDEPPPATVIAAFTVQEEVGLRGAQAAIQGQTADVGLAVDMTALDDTPDTGTQHLRMGAGPAVKIMDFSLQAHPAVIRGLEVAAERAQVQIQHEILMRIGTDAGALQFGGDGVPAGVISAGNRYTHSPVEVVDQRDLEGAVALLRAFLRALPDMDLRFTTI